MTDLPDVRGCWKCRESVRGDSEECPYCHAELVAEFDFQITFRDGSGHQEKAVGHVKAPVKIDPP